MEAKEKPDAQSGNPVGILLGDFRSSWAHDDFRPNLHRRVHTGHNHTCGRPLPEGIAALLSQLPELGSEDRHRLEPGSVARQNGNSDRIWNLPRRGTE